MPEVSRFYGIVIKIFYDDHNPPHFHAEYGEYEVLVSINTLALIGGRLPARALGMATEWAVAAPAGAPCGLGEGATVPDRLATLTRFRDNGRIDSMLTAGGSVRVHMR